MAALTTHNNVSRAFVWRAAGLNPTLANPCVWAAHAWVAWNAHVESYADATFRVDDFASSEALASHVCRQAFNGSFCANAKAATAKGSLVHALGLGEFRLKQHHRRHGACALADVATLDPIVAAQVVAMATRYGYQSSPSCDLALTRQLP
jgi:hypothetical protein